MRFLAMFGPAFAGALLLSCASIGAFATEQTTAAKDGLSVGQVLNVLSGLNQLTVSGTDATGRPQPAGYQLSGDVRIVVALNIDLGLRVQTQVQKATTALKYELSGGGPNVPPEKEGEMNKQIQAMLDAPSGVGFIHLKPADLCLDVSDRCKTANAIPAGVLALLIPILDR